MIPKRDPLTPLVFSYLALYLVAGLLGIDVVLRLLHVTHFLAFATPIGLLVDALEAVVLIGSVYLLGLRRTRQTWAAIGIRRISLSWVFGALSFGVLTILVGGLVGGALHWRLYMLLLPSLRLFHQQRVLLPAPARSQRMAHEKDKVLRRREDY